MSLRKASALTPLTMAPAKLPPRDSASAFTKASKLSREGRVKNATPANAAARMTIRNVFMPVFYRARSGGGVLMRGNFSNLKPQYQQEETEATQRGRRRGGRR